MKIIILILIFLLLMSKIACAETFLVNGKNKTCWGISELDKALSAQQSYFNNWTDANYDEAATWAGSCMHDGWEFSRATRVAMLRSFQKRQRSKEDQIVYLQNEKIQKSAEVEARNADAKKNIEIAETSRISDENKQNKMSECIISHDYLLYDAQESVIGDLETTATYEENIRTERKITKASGVRNLANDYNNGAEIVQSKENLKNDWQRYKSLGGKEKSANKVTHKLTDPCATYETAIQ